MNPKKLLQLCALGLALSGLSAPAQVPVFNYSDGDLILDFSQTGAAADVEVDVGSLTNLISAAHAAGGTVQLSAYDAASQLLGIFGNVTNVSFSVVGLQLNAAGSVAATTEYLTLKRAGTSPNTPPKDLTPSNQSAVESKVLGIVGLNSDGSLSTKGILPWSANPANPANATNNTATVVIIPTTSISSYTKIIGASFGPVNPKNTFVAGASIVSDLFEYDPVGSSQNTIYQGYFTFNSDGTLDFSLPAPPSTTITTITSSAGTVSVRFNTVAGVNYRLRYSPQVNTSRGTWTIIPGSVLGTGVPAILTDTSATNAARFYSVESY